MFARQLICTQAGLVKIGPWGGNGGRPYDIMVPPQCVKSMTICSGTVVDSIAFSYNDHNGRHHTAGPWGGHGGSNQTVSVSLKKLVRKSQDKQENTWVYFFMILTTN